jgi:hypothetical protein
MPRYIAGAQVKGESPPRRPSNTAWESYPGAVPPTRDVRPSPALCGSCAGRLVSFHDAVPPTPVPPPCRSLERGRRNPRKGYDHLPGTRPRRRRDVRPAKRVPSATSGPVRPSPSLCRHPERCSVIRDIVGTQIDGTSSRWLLCGLGLPSVEPSNRRTNGNQTRSSHTTTLEAAAGRAHDSPRRLPEARFARTTINSTTLCAMPPYVALRALRHDCKPPPLGL